MGNADTATLRPLAADGVIESASPATSSLWLRALKCLLAVLLLPFCVGFAVGFYDHVWSLGSRLKVVTLGWPVSLQWFFGGVGLFAALAILLWRPVVVYVFAHELVHALAAWACGGKVSNLQASASGGQVTTSKTNTFIRLAPYCVPLYAALVAVVFCTVDAWCRSLQGYHNPFAAVLGFMYAFHVGFTLWSLHRRQPDFKADGWFFSLVLIFLANVLVAAAVMGLTLNATPGGAWNTVTATCSNGWANSLEYYREGLEALRSYKR